MLGVSIHGKPDMPGMLNRATFRAAARLFEQQRHHDAVPLPGELLHLFEEGRVQLFQPEAEKQHCRSIAVEVV